MSPLAALACDALRAQLLIPPQTIIATSQGETAGLALHLRGGYTLCIPLA